MAAWTYRTVLTQAVPLKLAQSLVDMIVLGPLIDSASDVADCNPGHLNSHFELKPSRMDAAREPRGHQRLFFRAKLDQEVRFEVSTPPFLGEGER